MNTHVDERVSAAVIRFLGKGEFPSPRKRPEIVEAEFGADIARRVAELVTEMEAVSVDWNGISLGEGGTRAREEMQRRHPELSDDALAALRWHYTFIWR